MNPEQMDKAVKRASARATAEAKLNIKLEELKKFIIKRPNELTEAVSAIAPEIVIALTTNRGQIVRTITPRPMTTAEVGLLYELIGVLIDTNWALQQHSREVANLHELWEQSQKGMQTIQHRISHFANFLPIGEAEDEEADNANS